MMRAVLVCVLLAGVLGAQEWYEHRDTSVYTFIRAEVEHLELNTLKGSIAATASEDGAIVLTAIAVSRSPDSAVARVRLGEFECRRTLEDGVLRMRFNASDPDSCRVDLAVRIPDGVGVKLTAGYGDVSATGFRGALDLKTVQGRIAVDSHAGSVRADAAMGSIECTLDSVGAGDTLELETVDGDIRLNLLPGVQARLEVETYSGTVDIQRLRYESETWTEREVVTSVGTGLLGLGSCFIRVRNVAGSIVLFGR